MDEKTLEATKEHLNLAVGNVNSAKIDIEADGHEEESDMLRGISTMLNAMWHKVDDMKD